MKSSSVGWLLLASSFPGRDSGTARVKLWRRLKDAGVAMLRDGVTIIPATPWAHDRITEIVDEVEKAGGAAWVFVIPPQSPAIEKKLKALFDRRESYEPVASAIASLRKELSRLEEATARRRFRDAEAKFLAAAALDFFPVAPQSRTREGLDKLRSVIDRHFSPEEPSATTGAVARRDLRKFRSATWATRKRLWVDRVASAWLIRRFIDPAARFEWLDKPADCPVDAHGFDFDSAAFTHAGNLVTFEVLVAAFRLEGDPGLRGLARLVHYLDVGGDLVPEAAGFEGILSGLRASCASDDALLEAMTPVLDGLHKHFSEAPTG